MRQNASEMHLYHINYPLLVTNVSAYFICHEFKGEIENVWNSNGTIRHFFSNFSYPKTVESQVYNLNLSVFPI